MLEVGCNSILIHRRRLSAFRAFASRADRSAVGRRLSISPHHPSDLNPISRIPDLTLAFTSDIMSSEGKSFTLQSEHRRRHGSAHLDTLRGAGEESIASTAKGDVTRPSWLGSETVAL